MVIQHGKFKIILRPVALIALASVAGLVAWRFLTAGGNAVVDTLKANEQVVSPLVNGDFEESPVPALTEMGAKVPNRKAVVTGSISGDWKDRSRWGDLEVEYATERTTVHGGAQAQKVNVKAVRSGAVKFVQAIRTLPGKKYRLSIWAKSDRPMRITFGLRRVQSEAYENKVELSVGPQWQKVETTAVSSEPVGYFMLETSEIGVLLLDDATCVEI